MENKLSKRLWLNILLFSFMGGVAWNLENIYFNTFLYGSVYSGASEEVLASVMAPTTAISNMVSLSAITAVVTTFIMGTLSEKIKRRKIFISLGYTLWGIITASFGFITKENIAKVFGFSDDVKILTFAIWSVIIMDMIMTFMGSTSNDSAFNSWVTDVTTPSTRPKVETALMFIGVISMLAVMGVGSFAQNGTISYKVFFIGLGLVVTACGIMGLFTLEEPQIKGEKTNSNYWADLFYGFRPSVVKKNANLYLALAAVGLYNIAVQVFFPYLFVYLGEVVFADLVLDAKTIITAVISIAALVAGTVYLLKVGGKNKIMSFLPATALFVLGLFLLSTSTNVILVFIGVAPTAIGYIVLQVQLSAAVRDFIPQDKIGLFQGIRMIFAVLIPMVVGPKIGDIACRISNITIEEYGVEKLVPSTSMFLFAAVVAILVFVPLVILLKKKAFDSITKKVEEEYEEEEE